MTSYAEEFRKRFEAAAEKGLNEFDHQAFANAIVQELQHHKRKAILTMLGLEHTFGTWELSYSPDTMLPHLLTDEVKRVVGEWVNKEILTLMEDMKPRLRQQLNAALRRRVKDNMESVINRAAHEAAQQIVQALADEVTKDIVREGGP